MKKDADSTRKIDWQPLRVLALKTPYTMEYLSLMARRKQLKVKKVGRLWYSTLDNIRQFEKDMQARKEKKREQMRAKYYRKDEKEPEEKQPTKVRVSQAAIFDQIQSELEEVLQEIREKERRLREEYHEGISRVPLKVAAVMPPAPKIRINLQKKRAKESFLHKEKKETEDLSEKLIMDLGKLLNTANQIQEDVEVTHHTPFLSLNYPDQGYGHNQSFQNRSQVEIHNHNIDYTQHPTVKKSSWLSQLFILVISILIFVAILFMLYLLYEAKF